MSITIAFNTANLVAYYRDFKFELADWGKQAAQVTERTGPAEFAEILKKIRAAAYDAAEILNHWSK